MLKGFLRTWFGLGSVAGFFGIWAMLAQTYDPSTDKANFQIPPYPTLEDLAPLTVAAPPAASTPMKINQPTLPPVPNASPLPPMPTSTPIATYTLIPPTLPPTATVLVIPPTSTPIFPPPKLKTGGS